jgi:hypothetical protein
MATVTTTYQPKTLDDLLARPCGCGELAWYCAPPFGRIECAECGAAFSRPCGFPAPQGPDGDGPTPAAPAAAALVELAVSAARSARPFTHLSELSDSERAEYEAWAAELEASAPLPEPCCRCNRPASPYQDTDAGPLCFRCWPEPPTGPRPDRAALAAVWVDVLGELAEAEAVLARIDARLAALA